MASSEIELLRETVRHWVAQAADGSGLVATLTAEGWCEAVPTQEYAQWGMLFEEWSSELSSAAILDLFVLRALGVDESDAVVAYPAASPLRTSPESSGGVVGYVHGDWASSGTFVWLDPSGNSAAACAVDSVVLRAVNGLDPDFGLAVAELRAPLERAELDPVNVASAISGAHLMQAFSLVALGRRMLGLALEHVASRKQFGRPLASFQAVKHQAADAAVELEAARLLVDFAVETGDTTASAAARASAGRAADRVGRTAQQLMGAMGFTWEVPLHQFVRRAHVIDLLLGPWEHVALQLGEQMIDERRVPRLGTP